MSPEGAKDIDKESFHPSRALPVLFSYQGFAALIPGYGLARLRRWACLHVWAEARTH
jgi:hypothetical protein